MLWKRGEKEDTNWQSEDFVPLWIEALVDRVGHQSVISQFQHTEGVALSCRMQQTQMFTQRIRVANVDTKRKNKN